MLSFSLSFSPCRTFAQDCSFCAVETSAKPIAQSRILKEHRNYTRTITTTTTYKKYVMRCSSRTIIPCVLYLGVCVSVYARALTCVCMEVFKCLCVPPDPTHKSNTGRVLTPTYPHMLTNQPTARTRFLLKKKVKRMK